MSNHKQQINPPSGNSFNYVPGNDDYYGLRTNSKPLTPPIAIYARISTSKQEYEMQMKDLKPRVHEYQKNGYLIYTDKKKGSTEIAERQYLDTMIKDAEAGKFKTLYLWACDRLARDTRIGLDAMYAIEKAGVTIRVHTEPNCDTPDTKDLFSIEHRYVRDARLQSFNTAEREHFRITIRNRTHRAQGLAANKWPLPHDPPYGYKCDSKKTVRKGRTPNYKLKIFAKRKGKFIKEAGVVKRIFDMYVKQNLSSRKIAKILNEDGVPAPEGGKWGKDTVIYIIGKEIYTGKTELGKKLGKFPFKCDPIILRTTYDAAQEKKLERWTLSPRNLKNEYLFRGLIKCAKCRFYLFPRMKRGYACYQGVSDIDNVKRCKPRCGQISERKLATALVEHFLGTILYADEKVIDGWFKNEATNNTEDKLKLAEDKYNSLEKEKDKVDYLLRIGRYDVKKHKSEIDKLEEEQGGWEDKINEYQQGLLTIDEKEQHKKQALEVIKGLRNKVTFINTPDNPIPKGLKPTSNAFVKAHSVERTLPYGVIVKFVKFIMSKNLYRIIYYDKKGQKIRVFTQFHPISDDPKRGDAHRLRLDDIYRNSERVSDFD